jgi:hypothetical protein
LAVYGPDGQKRGRISISLPQYVAAVVFVCFGIVFASAISFASQDGTIKVVVINAETSKPIAFSVVEVHGIVDRRGITGPLGTVLFADVPPGTYDVEVLVSRSYLSQTLKNVAIRAGNTMTVIARVRPLPSVPPGVILMTPAPHLITTVMATSKPQPFDPDSVGPTSPLAAISNSLLYALSTLPGVVFQGSGSASIAGRPASQTQVSIDGAPVGGALPNLGLFAGDIFNGASVNSDTSTVAFTTRDPTLDWLGRLKQVEGNHTSSQSVVTGGGTVGRLGASATYATATQGVPLDGMRFLDSTGLDYVHNGLSSVSAETVKLRFPFSASNTLLASATSMQSVGTTICTVFTGPIPCGFGPNQATMSLSSFQVRDAVIAPRISGTLMLFSTSNNSANEGALFTNGVGSPQSGESHSVSSGLMTSGRVNFTSDYALTFNMETMLEGGSSSNTLGSYTYFAQIPDAHIFHASIQSPLVSTRRFTATVKAGVQDQGAESSEDTALHLTYNASSADSLIANVDIGALSRPTGFSNQMSGPAALTFNCAEHNALGSGPSAKSDGSRSSSFNLGWAHTGRKISASLTLGHAVDQDAVVSGVVGAEAFDSSLFPPSYLSQLNASASSACGTTAPYGLADVYYNISAIVDRAVYDTAQGGLQVTVSPNVFAAFTGGLTSARAYGSDGLLFSPESTVIAGRQFPDTPVATANVSLGAAVGHAGVLAYGDVHFVSANNPNNLPAYATLDAALQLPTQHGQVTFSMLNATNVHPGPFATIADAVPLPMLTGQYDTIAQPLMTPRTFEVAYQVQVGRNAESTDARSTLGASRILPYNIPGPRDPLEIDRQSEECGPEMLPILNAYDTAIRGYQRRIEAARTSAGYPTTFASLDFQDVRFVYRRSATGYAILMTYPTRADALAPGARSFMRALFFCSTIHMGTLSQARAAALYTSPYEERTSLRASLTTFSSTIGFYEMPNLIEDPTIALLPLPLVAPMDAFALNDVSRDCNESIRPAAAAFLSAFKPYATAFFAGRVVPALPGDFATTPGVWKSDTSSLRITSASDLTSEIEPCLLVHGATQAQLTALGLGFILQGSLNYTPTLGFYTLSGN